MARRMIVVGPPGSGKTTVAGGLAARLGVPHVELDALFWKAGWQQATVEELAETLAVATAGEAWVVDGNYYSATSAVTWPRAHTIVWLDLPRRSTIRAVAWRTGRQWVGRRELWPGSRQTAARGLALVRFAWREHGKYGRRYGPMSVAGSGPRWVRLRSRRAIEEWLASVVRGEADV